MIDSCGVSKLGSYNSKGSAPLVVGVGASAGGLTGFRQLLSALSPQVPLSLIVIQHFDPNRESRLAKLLAGCTDMRVVEGKDGLVIEANAVYVIPAAVLATVDQGRLRLEHDPSRAELRHAIDHLFFSLARNYKARSAGIVLSGSGDDGTAGLREIKRACGLTIAQDPSTASHPAMPSSAIRAGVVDTVLPLEQVPNTLERFAELPSEVIAPPAAAPQDEAALGLLIDTLDDEALERLADVLASNRGFDLKMYKAGTTRRRLLRRMVLAGHDNFESYIETLEQNPEEQRSLIHDLFIGVTEFFRDHEAFETLREEVVEPLVAAAEPAQALRVWVPGCATGEEAYSLAMLILDTIAAHADKSLELQVFATDVDEEALGIARAGCYPTSIAEQLGEERLRKYFIRDRDGYVVRPALRDAISFAAHDLGQDPPFSRMHLVSCRNVLIYFRPQAQEHVVEVLHFALQPEGALFLGSSESVARHKKLFSTISKQWKIYRKNGLSRPFTLRSAATRQSRGLPTFLPLRESRAESNARIGGDNAAAARKSLLSECVPPSVVVAADGEIIYTHGHLGPYLQFPQGEPRFELHSVVRPELTARVRSVVSRCRRELEPASSVATMPDMQSLQVRVTARPAPDLGEGAVIVSFVRVEESKPAPLQPSDPEEVALVEQLERELQATQEDLRNTVEELEASNEELRASHEESMSMNEELQSANEELEASSEELRSLNEELGTVNNELREKVEQVEQTNDDLSNFISSTQIATIFLDEQLRIKRFTPSARDLLRLDSSDEGRFVGDIARELLQNELIDDARTVLDQLNSKVRDLKTRDGRWVTRRVLPYRTEDRRIDGVVITLIDITDLKNTTEQLTHRERQQAVIARLGLQALEETDLETLLQQIVREVQQTLGTDYCKILELQPDGDQLLLRAGVGWQDGLVGRATVGTGLDSQAGYTLRSTQPVIVDDLSVEKRFSGPPLLIQHGVTSGISCVIRDGDGIYGVFGAHTRRQRSFSNEDTLFLQAVAAVVAAAIGRFYSRARMTLEAEVAKAVTTAKSLEEVAGQVHAAFAKVLGTKVGELWWREPSDEAMVCRSLSAELPFDADQISADFCNRRFERGEGLVGRVFESGKAEWLNALGIHSYFARADQAAKKGLELAMGLPVHVGEQVCGVLTLFSTRNLVVHQPFLQSLDSLGRIIGEFVRRSEAEDARRENERRFSDIFTHAGVSLWEQDFSAVEAALDSLESQGIDDLRSHLTQHPEVIEELVGLIDVLDINQHTLKLFGASSKDELMSSLDILFTAETYETFVDELLALSRGDSLFAADSRMKSIDGRMIDVTLTVTFANREAGLDRSLVSIMDVSELKKAQYELEESRRWFARLAKTTPDTIAVIDLAQGRFVYTNGRVLELLGYTAEEIEEMGESATELIVHPDDREAQAQFYEPLSEDGVDVVEQTVRIRHADGNYRWLQRRAVPFEFDEDGNVRQVLTVGRDVTNLKDAEEKLQEASSQKDEFLAMLGHELRNPLAAVRSASESLKLIGADDPMLQRIQGILDRQTTHMAKLLDGLLDVSRIVRGKIVLDREIVDLVSVVEHVVEDRHDQLDQSKLELHTKLADKPVPVDGDPVRLTQIVDNLLSNAIKYTEAPGDISLTVRCEDDEAVLEVTDTGSGIEAKLLPHVFETFRQARQSIDRGSGGLGLGLALVKGLTELHGGSVTAHSAGKQQGATFTVRLPLAERPSNALARPAANEASGTRRILLVEDNEDAATLLRDLLTIKGHQVVLAADGMQALELAEEFGPDVVLCDLGLPGGMSGYDVARAMRESGEFAQTVMVAVTGYGRPEDQRRSLEAGFDAHTTKPVDMATIEELLSSSRG